MNLEELEKVKDSLKLMNNMVLSGEYHSAISEYSFKESLTLINEEIARGLSSKLDFKILEDSNDIYLKMSLLSINNSKDIINELNRKYPSELSTIPKIQTILQPGKNPGDCLNSFLRGQYPELVKKSIKELSIKITVPLFMKNIFECLPKEELKEKFPEIENDFLNNI